MAAKRKKLWPRGTKRQHLVGGLVLVVFWFVARLAIDGWHVFDPHNLFDMYRYGVLDAVLLVALFFFGVALVVKEQPVPKNEKSATIETKPTTNKRDTK